MTQLKQLLTTINFFLFQQKEHMTNHNEDFDELSTRTWDMAMRYLSMGWSIIPLRISDKMPAIQWKEFQERQPTEEEVGHWFEHGVPDGHGGSTKAFGLAVVTGHLSGLIVADCDNQDALTYAVTEAGLFSLMTVATTRGQHIYFKHPGGSERIQNKVGGLGRDWPSVQGFDLRGDGGYVVAPPSVKFDKDGKFQHTYAFNCPSEEVEVFAASLPIWPGVKVKQAQQHVPMGEWSFDNIQLSSVKTYGETVWDEAGERVKALGRKMRDGDGRNPWMVRYIGECISSGMDEGQARVAGDQFQITFYDPELPKEEFESVLLSVVTSDKRNHPEKYAAAEKYDNKNEERKKRANAIRLIKPNNLAALRLLSAGRKYLIDPFIPPASIIQVVGFNGHGKSLWLLNLLWAAARGQSYGSAHVEQKMSALYLDFEGSANTLNERVEDCVQMHGDMDESLTIWNANVSGDDMCLNDGGAETRLGEMIDEVKPQVVIIDTVRQAWLGMEENSPHSWVKVNNVALAIRNAGMSVILVHHRNKPNMQGHGREAGSTAQLKDLDVQIIVTKVVEDLDQAKREAAMPDEATSVIDFAGSRSTAWAYLRRTLGPDDKLLMVFEISFGKLRQSGENNVTTYVGTAENRLTGVKSTVSTLTPKQKVLALAKNGVELDVISERVGVSRATAKGWMTPATTVGVAA